MAVKSARLWKKGKEEERVKEGEEVVSFIIAKENLKTQTTVNVVMCMEGRKV